MSAPVPNLRQMIHPWRRLRALAHVTLKWHDHAPDGVTDFEAGVVSLRRGMDQARRRSTLMHELLHVERGPVPMGLAAREELRVWKEAARLLLPDVEAIGDALAWAHGDLAAAADELWVDVPTLRMRLKYLHPVERGWLRKRLEDH